MKRLLEIKLAVLQFFTVPFLTYVPEILPFCCRTRPVPGLGKYKYDPDFDVNVTNIITGKGYPVETHCVTTEDGYILSIQRIPHGRLSPQGQSKEVVLLIHGILFDSTLWVSNFPNQSLGFILADEGLDVWLGNTRGNTYSRKHEYLSTEEFEFWDFSFDEIGKYDLPAMIDYVLNNNGKENLYFIGHSQGATSAFTLLSESPEYNGKIKLFIAYAPAIFFRYAKGFVAQLAPLTPLLHAALYTFGISEVFPSNAATKLFARYVCGTEGIVFCEFLIKELFGGDCQQTNQTRVPVYFSEFPGGSSFKSALHFNQLMDSKKFEKYDYYEKNILYYNQTSPPEYNLRNVTTSVAVFVGMNDIAVTPEDAEMFKTELKKLVFYKVVPFRCFSHLDFAYALDAPDLVYRETLQLMKKY